MTTKTNGSNFYFPHQISPLKFIFSEKKIQFLPRFINEVAWT